MSLYRSWYVFPVLLRLQYCWYNVWYARSVDAASASRRIVFSSASVGLWLSAGPPCGNLVFLTSSASWQATMYAVCSATGAVASGLAG